MANPELPPRPPGVQAVFKTPEQENPLLNRTGRFINWIQVYQEHKAQQFEQIYQYEREPIDQEQLSKAPLFKFGEGFTSDPPPPYRKGEVPAFAPMSREEMRILLVNTLPPAVIPFVFDRFVFNYALPPDGYDSPPPGPTVQVGKDGKVHVTFYHDNFYTKGAPLRSQHSQDKLERERARHMAAFMDPSKITIFMGRILAKMVDPPANWHEIAPPNFRITADKTDKKRQRELPKLPPDVVKAQRLKRQWEDFVALAVAHPEVAQQRYPTVYEYWLKQAERFSSVTYSNVALAKLLAESHDGFLQLNDVEVVVDTRTEDEKMADQGLSPQRSRIEGFMDKLNKLTSKFGFIITYKKPTDHQRAALMAEDDKEIKALLDTMNTEERDLMFGNLMSERGNERNPKAKNAGRRLLLAFSQNGEFNDWRVWAWLLKFSDTFRRTSGRQISETEYEDLQLIYSQSEKIGNRLGTGVLPFKAISLTPQNHPEATYYGRPVKVIVRKDYEKEYVPEVEDAVAAKEGKALLDASDKGFKLVKTPDGAWIPLTARYDASPAGMMTANGNLARLMHPDQAKALAAQLSKMGVYKVPRDVVALAKGQEKFIQKNPGQVDKHVKPTALKVIQHYRPELVEPPEAEVKKLKAIPAKDLALSNNPKEILLRLDEGGKTAETIILSIEANMAQTPLLKITQKAILSLLRQGVTKPEKLLAQTAGFIQSKLGVGTLAAQQEYFSLLNFLYRPKTQQALGLLAETNEYLQALEPRYAVPVMDAAEEIKMKPALILGDDSIYDNPDHERFEALQKYKIIDIRELERLGERPAAREDADGSTTEVDELAFAQQTREARKNYVQSKLVEADDHALRLATATILKKSLNSLEKSLNTAGLGDSYHKRYEDWLKAGGRLFSASSLSEVRHDLEKGIAAADMPARNEAQLKTVQRGLDQITSVIDELNRALNFVEAESSGQKASKPDYAKDEDED